LGQCDVNLSSLVHNERFPLLYSQLKQAFINTIQLRGRDFGKIHINI
jgi:hypothetical protein